jgi:hypothetical protein
MLRFILAAMAFMIKEEDIPVSLYVNSDQTQIIYTQGSSLTWMKRGAKQVSTIGEDEKRALTAVVSISCSGKLLPLQAVYQGATMKSCPRSMAACYNECISHGFQFECSKTDTYWSTHETMESLVDNIIAPYFEAEKKKLGLPPSQKAIWQIDIWSVHRSERFQSWMKKQHPSIMLHFVPGGCTSILQPCDVGIQRVFKHSLKRSYHEDIVKIMTAQIESEAEALIFDRRRGFLRDMSVKWLWDAYQAVNKPEIVRKVGTDSENDSENLPIGWLQAFALSSVHDLNLSYEILTSFSAREILRQLKNTDPSFWKELNEGRQHAVADLEAGALEDELTKIQEEVAVDDDSAVPICQVSSELVLDNKAAGIGSRNGGIVPWGEAESLDFSGGDEVARKVEDELRHGKHKRKANMLYSHSFWLSRDD